MPRLFSSIAFCWRLLLCGALLPVPALATICDSSTIDAEPRVNGWSRGVRNQRWVPAAAAGITAANVQSLQPQWVFGLPDTSMPRTQPLVTRDSVVIGDDGGGVYALDRHSGCEKWRFDVGSQVRTNFRVTRVGAQQQLYFGTMDAEVVVLDLLTGKEVLRRKIEQHPKAMLSGSATEHEGVVYQPVSSWEVAWAINPFYACCTFRSSVVALSVGDWQPLWKAFTIEQEATVYEKRWLLPDRKGPSGAPVWSQPTLDTRRGRVYVGTGENYSEPATDTSDAILAFDMDSGAMLWSQQLLANDIWNLACITSLHTNCPEQQGDDLDFGAPPILATVNGRDVILAGQKSGWVFALDPDHDGALLWSYKAGAGGKAGGVHFGMAVDEARGVLYVPISDRGVEIVGSSHDGTPTPSLHAVDIATGKPLWVRESPATCLPENADARTAKPIKGCYRGFSAAITITEELVFAPTLDGVIRAFDSVTGKQLWSWDSARDFDAVNAVDTSGGAIDLGGVYLDGGQLFVNSGYGNFNQRKGNAFVVLKVADTAQQADSNEQ